MLACTWDPSVTCVAGTILTQIGKTGLFGLLFFLSISKYVRLARIPQWGIRAELQLLPEAVYKPD
jgi:hypothetical protein